MKIKYLVYSGIVTSKNDGQQHRVSAREVMNLYKLDPEECVLNPTKFIEYFCENLKKLYPRSDGNYNLEDKINETTSN